MLESRIEQILEKYKKEMVKEISKDISLIISYENHPIFNNHLLKKSSLMFSTKISIEGTVEKEVNKVLEKHYSKEIAKEILKNFFEKNDNKKKKELQIVKVILFIFNGYLLYSLISL